MHLALTVLLALAFSIPPGFGIAQPQPTSLAEFRRSNDALALILIASTRRGAPPPRLSDPVEGPVIRAALDEHALAFVDSDDLAEALDACAAPAPLREAYMFDGVGVGARSERTGRGDMTRLARMAENKRQYRDELALVIAFDIACTAKVNGAATTFWAALPPAQRTSVRLAGIGQARAGAAEVYAGALRSLTEPQHNAENKALILNALVRNADGLGAVLTPALRQLVLSTFDSVMPVVSPAVAADLRRLRDVLAAAPCAGLCAV